MNRTLLLLRLGSAALVPAVAVTVAAAPALAAPPDNGCPAGYALLSVPTLAADGYQVPGMVDDPDSGIRSFGHVGNDDDWVCGVQLGKKVAGFDGPLYNFIDNQLPV